MKTAVQHIICATFLTLLQLIDALSTKYEILDAFKDFLCTAAFVESIFHAPSLSTCLAFCSMKTDCIAVVYIRKNETCFRLRPNFHGDDFTTRFVGARSYMQEAAQCPDGWTFMYKSCYRFSVSYMTQSEGVAECTGFHRHAHLADFKSIDEFQTALKWFNVTKTFYEVSFIGATFYNGWKWSDGTPVSYLIGETNTQFACLILFKFETKWYRASCYGIWQVLCELDVW